MTDEVKTTPTLEPTEMCKGHCKRCDKWIVSARSLTAVVQSLADHDAYVHDRSVQ